MEEQGVKSQFEHFCKTGTNSIWLKSRLSLAEIAPFKVCIIRNKRAFFEKTIVCSSLAFVHRELSTHNRLIRSLESRRISRFVARRCTHARELRSEDIAKAREATEVARLFEPLSHPTFSYLVSVVSRRFDQRAFLRCGQKLSVDEEIKCHFVSQKAEAQS